MGTLRRIDQDNGGFGRGRDASLGGRIWPIAWRLATLACWGLAAFIACDTVRTLARLQSSLPWFDEWATVDLLHDWLVDDVPLTSVLFAQHNEHRILFPRLIFFADDLVFKGQGILAGVMIILVQTAHALMFLWILKRARPQAAGRWAIGGVVVALMFGLQQWENFASGFQLQFFSVFAAATLAFLMMAKAVGAWQEQRPYWSSLAAALAAALFSAFTMANGLICGFVIVLLAMAARLPRGIVAICLGFAVLLVLIYLQGYEGAPDHGDPLQTLRRPFAIMVYVAAYLGNVLTTSDFISAAALGFCGLAAAALAGLGIVLSPSPRPTELALFGIMAFVVGTAIITACGRLGLGLEQALSSRYVTGSVAFWAAQLTFWWLKPLPRPLGPLARAGTAMIAALLLVAVFDARSRAKPLLIAKAFAQSEASDLWLLGLSDRRIVEATAWSLEDPSRLMPFLKERHISIFASQDGARVNRPLTEVGPFAGAERCAGALDKAAADASLGEGGVRVAGRASIPADHRTIHRILVADAKGNVAGFGTGGAPGTSPGAWRGFARAPVGEPLTAYGLLPGGQLCALGSASVSDAAPKTD